MTALPPLRCTSRELARPDQAAAAEEVLQRAIELCSAVEGLPRIAVTAVRRSGSAF